MGAKRMSSRIVKFDYRKDENQFPIINPLQIEGDLVETAVKTYEFNKDKRIIKKKLISRIECVLRRKILLIIIV